MPPGRVGLLSQLVSVAKNAGGWPRNRSIAVRNLATLIAAPFVSVGRMIEHVGNLRPRNVVVGSGMIRFVWKSVPPNGFSLRSGNTSPFVGSVTGGASPALSLQVWKCIVSVGPMLRTIRSTSGSVTLCASDGYRLLPPCSPVAE
jgi:hypothetical protein